MLDFIDKILYDEEAVRDAIDSICLDLVDNLNGDVIFVAILEGGMYLAEKLLCDMDKHSIYSIITNSYVNNEKLPNDEILINMDELPDIKDKTVVLVDDIYDTGSTLHKVNRVLMEMGAKEIKNVVLVKRTGHHNYDIDLFAYGLELKTNEFLVGCGMDYNREHRDLPYIASIKGKQYD